MNGLVRKFIKVQYQNGWSRKVFLLDQVNAPTYVRNILVVLLERLVLVVVPPDDQILAGLELEQPALLQGFKYELRLFGDHLLLVEQLHLAAEPGVRQQAASSVARDLF